MSAHNACQPRDRTSAGAKITTAGAKFGLGLVWAMLLGTAAIVLLVEMSGRFASVARKPYAAAIREHFGFKFYLLPFATELIADSILLTAELGGVAIAMSLFTGTPGAISSTSRRSWSGSWRGGRRSR